MTGRQMEIREVQQKTSWRNSLSRRERLNVLSAAKNAERSNEKVLGKCPSALTDSGWREGKIGGRV